MRLPSANEVKRAQSLLLLNNVQSFYLRFLPKGKRGPGYAVKCAVVNWGGSWTVRGLDRAGGVNGVSFSANVGLRDHGFPVTPDGEIEAETAAGLYALSLRAEQAHTSARNRWLRDIERARDRRLEVGRIL